MGWQQGRNWYSGKRISLLVDKVQQNPTKSLVSRIRMLNELLVVVLQGVEKVFENTKILGRWNGFHLLNHFVP